VVFLIPEANVEFVHKFHVAPHASYSTLPKLTSKISAQNLIIQSYQSFVIIQNANSDIRQIAQFLSSAAYSNSPLSFALLLHFATLYVNYNLPLRKEERSHPGPVRAAYFLYLYL